MSAAKLAWGVGVATVAPNDAVLDVFFRKLGWGDKAPEELLASLPQAHTDPRRGVGMVPVNISIDTSTAPRDATDAYLRLHLMSHRLALPNSLNLDGIFGLLTNVAWTSLGAVPVDQIDEVTYNLRRNGEHLTIHGVDKFPRMTDYVVPSGVRIADASRVRLGAHLATGTTVMHEGFCNFNAGTLGTSMVEGRISAGVIVDDGSDIGGGASIMGTLSGGGKEVIRVGKRCLLGANSGLGISLGDDCIIEAGLYVTGGTLVKLPDATIVKARELSGANNLLFRRNSQTGAVEASQRTGSWGGLNSALHKN
ncbi:2,3,4,5-tetrahydropyridine-2,6-dicarboxylate N-succinyltransferase [Acidimicrobiaceae bacterium]|nr:2,3,4,5-tetrahydropyridine-2,6-dicarboxylate N-succinyltransferase [Acidimicrobiaceae bacterium]